MVDRIKYLDRSKDGRIYFRIKGKRERLPNDETTSEFAAAYDALLAGALMPKPKRSARLAPNTPGSIGWFIGHYLASDYFVGRDGRQPKLSPGTQLNYRAALEAIRVRLGPAMLGDLTPENVDVYLGRIEREHTPSVARMHRMMLSNLWKFARGFAEFKRNGRTNPTADAKDSYRVEQEHEPWPDDVQDRFTAACDVNLYLAFHLLLCTGQRVSDIVKMKWAEFDGTHFKLVQQKTDEPMSIRAPKILRELLARTDRVHENILTHKWHKPYTRDSLGHRIKDRLIANGDGRYTTHGLRKNAGILLAENGATVAQIMAALGHRSPKLALYYTRLANQKKLNDQAVAIMDAVFERREAAKAAKVAARRAQIKRVT
jgi:integrase